MSAEEYAAYVEKRTFSSHLSSAFLTWLQVPLFLCAVPGMTEVLILARLDTILQVLRRLRSMSKALFSSTDPSCRLLPGSATSLAPEKLDAHEILSVQEIKEVYADVAQRGLCGKAVRTEWDSASALLTQTLDSVTETPPLSFDALYPLAKVQRKVARPTRSASRGTSTSSDSEDIVVAPSAKTSSRGKKPIRRVADSEEFALRERKSKKPRKAEPESENDGKEEAKEESKDESKEESKDESKEESKDELKDQAKDEPKQASSDNYKVTSSDDSGEELKKEAKEKGNGAREDQSDFEEGVLKRKSRVLKRTFLEEEVQDVLTLAQR